MPWYVYALASASFFAAQALILRLLAVKSSVPRIFSLVFSAWGAFFAIIVFMIQGGSFADISRLSFTQILLIMSAILLYGLYERFQFVARKGVEASTLAVLFRLQTVIAFAGSILFLGESLTLTKILGTILIIGASLLLVYNNPKLQFSRGFMYAILCSVLMGIVIVVDKPASANIQPSLYSFLMWCFPILIVAFPGIKIQDLQKELAIGRWKVALAAFLNVVGYILFIRSLSRADASRVIPVVSINSILIVLGGVILLGERDHLWRKLAAGIIAFAGVYLLK